MASQGLDITPPKSASVAKMQQANQLDSPSRMTRYQLRRMSTVGTSTADAAAPDAKASTRRSTRSRHSVAGFASEDSDAASIQSEPGGGCVTTRRNTRASSQQPRTPPKVQATRTRRNSMSSAASSTKVRTTRSRPKLSPVPSEEVSTLKSSPKKDVSVSPTKRDSFGSPRRLFSGEKSSAEVNPSRLAADVIVPLSEPKRLSLRTMSSPRSAKNPRLVMKHLDKKLDMLSKNAEEPSTSSDNALTPKSKSSPDVSKVNDSPKTPGSIEDISLKTPESGALKSSRLSGSEENGPLSPFPSVRSPPSHSQSGTPRKPSLESDKSDCSTPQTRSKTPLSYSSKHVTPQAVFQAPKSESHNKATPPQLVLSSPQTPLSYLDKNLTPQTFSQNLQNDSSKETPKSVPQTRSQTPLLSDSDKKATPHAVSRVSQGDSCNETPQKQLSTPQTSHSDLKNATPLAPNTTPQSDLCKNTPQSSTQTGSRTPLSDSSKKSTPRALNDAPETRSRTSLSNSAKKATPQAASNTPQNEFGKNTPQSPSQKGSRTPFSDSSKKVTPQAHTESFRSGSLTSQEQQEDDASISMRSTSSESGKKIEHRASVGGRNLTPQRVVEEKAAAPEFRSVTPQSDQTPEKLRTRSSTSESENSPRLSLRYSQSQIRSESEVFSTGNILKSPASGLVSVVAFEKQETTVLGGSPRLPSRLSLRKTCPQVDHVEETVSASPKAEKQCLESGNLSGGNVETERGFDAEAEEDKVVERSEPIEESDAADGVELGKSSKDENSGELNEEFERSDTIVLKKIAVTEETDEDSDGEAVIAEFQEIEEDDEPGLETEDEIEEGEKDAILKVLDSDEDRADEEDEWGDGAADEDEEGVHSNSEDAVNPENEDYDDVGLKSEGEEEDDDAKENEESNNGNNFGLEGLISPKFLKMFENFDKLVNRRRSDAGVYKDFPSLCVDKSLAVEQTSSDSSTEAISVEASEEELILFAPPTSSNELSVQEPKLLVTSPSPKGPVSSKAPCKPPLPKPKTVVKIPVGKKSRKRNSLEPEDAYDFSILGNIPSKRRSSFVVRDTPVPPFKEVKPKSKLAFVDRKLVPIQTFARKAQVSQTVKFASGVWNVCKLEKEKKRNRHAGESRLDDEDAPRKPNAKKEKKQHRAANGPRFTNEVAPQKHKENKKQHQQHPLDGRAPKDNNEKKTLGTEDLRHKLTKSKKTENRRIVPSLPPHSNFELESVKKQEKSKSKECHLDEAASLSIKKKKAVSVGERSKSHKRKASCEDTQLVNAESSKKFKVDNEGDDFFYDSSGLDKKMKKKKKLEERLQKTMQIERRDFAAAGNYDDDDAPIAVSFSDSRQLALQEESKKEVFLAEMEKLCKERKKLKQQRKTEQKAEKLKRKADSLEDLVGQSGSVVLPKGKKTYFGEKHHEHKPSVEAAPSQKKRRSEESSFIHEKLQKESAERERKQREKGLAALRKRHKAMSASFIPLEAPAPSGATRFGVVPLKNLNDGGNLIGDAAAFRSQMLYGNRVNRVPNSVLVSQNEKKNAFNSFSTSKRT